MKKYLKENWKPLLVGYATTMAFVYLLEFIESIILKIAMIITGI